MLLGSRFDDALLYARRLHAGQTRKASDVPYLAHLLSVAALVLEHGADEDVAIAALLHDAVEDQGGDATHAHILAEFGERVAGIVAACSDSHTQPKPPWRQRKQAHLDALANASRDVRLVTVADKLHNARCLLADLERLGNDVWQRFNGGREGTLWYYRAMHDALARCGPLPMLDEFAAVLSRIERAAGV